MSQHSPWPAPAPGDIVWCLFPEIPDLEPGPKPRPALVLRVEEREDGALLQVVYGTSQRLDRLSAGEMAITRAQHPAAYELAGLAYDTKFNFKATVELPWTTRYFKAPLRNRHGNTPKIGTLHITCMHAAQAAYHAAMKT